MTTTPSRPPQASGTHAPGTTGTTRLRRTFARWLASFLGYPVGGYAAYLLLGPLESTSAALAGGALTGVVLGLAQSWAFGRSRPRGTAWVLSTAVGLAAGTALGASVTDYTTDPTSLVVLGAVTGMAVGIAQGVVLIPHIRAAALVWPVLLTGAWALGWLVSEAVIGSSVDNHFYIFGSSGAIVVTVLTAPLSLVLERRAHVRSPFAGARAAGRTS